MAINTTNELGAFVLRMRARGQQVQDSVNTIVRQCALVADRELVLATPVDTGRARSNWLVSLDTPIDTEIDAYVEGEGGSTASANTQAAIEQAQGVIAARPPEHDICITNNVPYISELNDGSSAQAPAGFVQQAVQRAAAAIRNMRVFPDGN